MSPKKQTAVSLGSKSSLFFILLLLVICKLSASVCMVNIDEVHILCLKLKNKGWYCISELSNVVKGQTMAGTCWVSRWFYRRCYGWTQCWSQTWFFSWAHFIKQLSIKYVWKIIIYRSDNLSLVVMIYKCVLKIII